MRPLTPIPALDASGITSLAAGGEVTCYVADGKVMCAGANDRGQLGTGAAESTPRSMPASVVAGKP